MTLQEHDKMCADGYDDDGNEIVESGSVWSIARRRNGEFVRHYVGQVDQIFTSINRALDDCGVCP